MVPGEQVYGLENLKKKTRKGIESSPETQIFKSLYYLMVKTVDISSKTIHSLNYLGSKKLGCKDIEIRKFEFVAKTQFPCSQILIYFCHSLHYIRSLYLLLIVEWVNMKYLQDTDCSTKLDSSEHEVSAGYRVFH